MVPDFTMTGLTAHLCQDWSRNCKADLCVEEHFPQPRHRDLPAGASIR